MMAESRPRRGSASNNNGTTARGRLTGLTPTVLSQAVDTLRTDPSLRNEVASLLREIAPQISQRPQQNAAGRAPLAGFTDGDIENRPGEASATPYQEETIAVEMPEGTPHRDSEEPQDAQEEVTGPPLRRWLGWMEKSVPFVALLLVKILYAHRLGICILLGLFGTFIHTNATIKSQVALKERRSVKMLLWLVLFLTANIMLIYYVFEEEQLQNSLILMQPNFAWVDFWTLLWVVGMTDFVIKFMSMAVKCLIVLLPRGVMHFKRRGKYYMFVEQLAQYYRSLTPMPVWYKFLSDSDHSGGPILAFLLTASYFILKTLGLWNKAKQLRQAWLKVIRDTNYGQPASQDQMVAAGNVCAICQEDFKGPISLQCKHVFCEDCVLVWFDREKTCPMCRAEIADDPLWRDGATSAFVQLY
ncbi:PREDICTED: RING finger and transmembrane domain-containing protein 2-like [Branchiostoma belcheri]|uniref:RING finger and transmembrane domain-containing protein 2-like n=1 Tax=Branchiostoma belcheri TaxID=7741 RepID=A0A6P5AH21_BRABE|nr:PREDICTED: RING finger and transmembrane domain-containing protein 2-like [Branchiostoma belcheri]